MNILKFPNCQIGYFPEYFMRALKISYKMLKGPRNLFRKSI